MTQHLAIPPHSRRLTQVAMIGLLLIATGSFANGAARQLISLAPTIATPASTIPNARALSSSDIALMMTPAPFVAAPPAHTAPASTVQTPEPEPLVGEVAAATMPAIETASEAPAVDVAAIEPAATEAAGMEAAAASPEPTVPLGVE